MERDKKKQVSGEIPFDFADEPDERADIALKSLANGGEGFCERF